MPRDKAIRQCGRSVGGDVALACLALLLSGCGGSEGPPRVAVEGSVLLDGRPLESGSILFIPADGTHGPKVGTRIREGIYRLPRAEGPMIGTLRVEIRADQDLGYDPTEPEHTVLHADEPVPPNPVPPIYNQGSTLTVETKAEGENRFDFDLKTES